METLTKKKDKTITLLESGKVRIKIQELEYFEMVSALQETIEYYSRHNWKILTIYTFQTRAIVALVHELLKRLSVSKVKLTLTRPEAELFWGAITATDLPINSFPSLTILMGKLHQKLS